MNGSIHFSPFRVPYESICPKLFKFMFLMSGSLFHNSPLPTIREAYNIKMRIVGTEWNIEVLVENFILDNGLL